jgi:hypothetical protein
MLALDIETLGLLVEPLPAITCVCLYDGTVEHSLPFYRVPAAVQEANRQTLLGLMDSAQALVGYNAILFDLEYIRRFFGVPEAQHSAWVKKTIDPYFFIKTQLKKTCGLNSMLGFNRMASKSGSGLQAIVWAKQGRMDRVLAYCMLDARLVYDLCLLPHIRIDDFWSAQVHQDAEGLIQWSAEKTGPKKEDPLPMAGLVSVDQMIAKGWVALAPAEGLVAPSSGLVAPCSGLVAPCSGLVDVGLLLAEGRVGLLVIKRKHAAPVDRLLA